MPRVWQMRFMGCWWLVEYWAIHCSLVRLPSIVAMIHPAARALPRIHTDRHGSEERLDQAGADAAEEVFAVGFGLGEGFGLVAVFERDLLKKKFDGILGLEALGNQFSDAGGEVFSVGAAEAGEVVSAFVVAEFGGGQAVIGGAGFGIVQQRGKRIIPFALGTGPSLEGMIGSPDDLSCGFLF